MAWSEQQLKYFLEDRTVLKTQELVKWLFPEIKAAQNITFHQAYIVKRIAFSEAKRINISAYTRYGKSQMVAIAVAIYILINENKKVKFIGPTDDQAGIIKNYMSELILGSRDGILLNMAEIQSKGPARIKAEASQRRLTFKNGCEYRVVTAHGKGFTAMGHGGDLLIMDEAAMISREAYAKITRMLGDDPENSTLVELYNPWDRDTKAFDHSISPLFERIQIDWTIGIKEGRTTQAYIDEMRGDVTPLEFTVLYDSRFPDEAEDSLHTVASIESAEHKFFGFLETVEQLIRDIRNPEISADERADRKKELSRYKKIISCDPADMGIDLTVILWGISKDNQYYEPLGLFHEPKSDAMNIVGRMIRMSKQWIEPEIMGYLQPDQIGLGVGILSRLKEIREEQKLNNLRIMGCHYGEQANNSTEFSNKKAENNFRLKNLFLDGYVALGVLAKHKDYHRIKNELLNMKWEITSSEKKKIIDPESKSPDFNDALAYFVWKDKKSLAYGFV